MKRLFSNPRHLARLMAALLSFQVAQSAWAVKTPTMSGSVTAQEWEAYRARFIEPVRIKAGLKFWDTYGDRLREAEQRYGVPADIIAAIIADRVIWDATGDLAQLP